VNCTGFNVERSLKPSAGFKLVAKINGGTLRSYSDAGLAATTTYYYRVRAVEGTRRSSYSTLAIAMTPTIEATPARRQHPAPDIATTTARSASPSNNSATWRSGSFAGSCEGCVLQMNVPGGTVGGGVIVVALLALALMLATGTSRKRSVRRRPGSKRKPIRRTAA
jgi:hypothetical protein